MASQALYRRYRSQTFAELIGQEHVVQTLRNALHEGRVAHAYLFTGPRGVGKTTVARLLAKAVNCTAPEAERPCGTCDSCLEIAENRSVDVIEIDAASHTSVEDAREIIERVQFRPTKGIYKVYIIDEVHMLSTAAFNALLKTLEEPPGHALFILATTEVHKIPATILSRCQQFTFSRHTINSTVDHLNAIAAEEGFSLETGAAEAIARAATGSMRDALSLLDQLMAYGSPSIQLDQVQNLIGATSSQEVAELTASLINNDVANALLVISRIVDQGADLRQFARDLVYRLRALMLLKAGGSAALIDTTEDDLANLNEQAHHADLGALVQWVRMFSALDQQIRTAMIAQLPLEMAVVEALTTPTPSASAPRPTPTPVRQQATPTRTVAPPPAKESTAPTRTVAPPPKEPTVPARTVAPPPAKEPTAPTSNEPLETPLVAPIVQESAPELPSTAPITAEEAPHPADLPEVPPVQPPTTHEMHDDGQIAQANAAAEVLERVEHVWNDIIRDVRVQDKTLQALLNSGVRPVDVKDNVVWLEVANDWLLKRLEVVTARSIVERVLSKHIGSNYGIRCLVKEQDRENPNQLREQIREARKDPLVKAAINIFDADIIAVERENQGETT